jgi:hypothetical protein
LKKGVILKIGCYLYLSLGLSGVTDGKKQFQDLWRQQVKGKQVGAPTVPSAVIRGSN